MGTLRQAGILVSIWHPLPVQGNLGALNQVCSRKIATTRWLHQLMVYFCGYREPTKEEKLKIFTVFFFINFEFYCTMMLYWKDGSLSLFKMYTRALTLSFSSSGRLSIFFLKRRMVGLPCCRNCNIWFHRLLIDQLAGVTKKAFWHISVGYSMLFLIQH